MSEPPTWTAPESDPARPAGSPPNGADPSGPYPSGAYPQPAPPAAPYPAGDFPTSAYPSGAPPQAGPYPPGAYSPGPYPPGPYPPYGSTGAFAVPPAGWAPPNNQAPNNQAPNGPYGPPPPGWAPRPPVYRPGVIPLRPLGLSDILEGAVAYVRANPRTTLGLSALVVTISTLVQIPLQVSFLGAVNGITASATRPGAQLAALTSLYSGSAPTFGVSYLLGYVSGTLLTGMLVVVLSRAVTGGRASMREAWAALRPRLLGLFGVTLLVALALVLMLALAVALVVVVALVGAPTGVTVLVGVVIGIAAICAMVYVGVHLSLATPAYVLEPLGVTAAFRRSFRLVRGQFWRIFGIQLLAGLIATILSGILTLPFSLVGGALSGLSATGSGALPVTPTVLLGSLGAIIASTLVVPFSAGVKGLLYIDQRIRREALDLELARIARGAAG